MVWCLLVVFCGLGLWVSLAICGFSFQLCIWWFDGHFYAALFSALKQSHCDFVACDSKWVTSVFWISTDVVYLSAFGLVHGWCHVKLLPFWHVQCTPYNHVYFCILPYACTHSCMHKLTHMRLHLNTQTYMHAYTYTRACRNTHALTHTHTHTHTHVHTRTHFHRVVVMAVGCGLQPEISEIILMGGGSRLPRVQELLLKYSGKYVTVCHRCCHGNSFRHWPCITCTAGIDCVHLSPTLCVHAPLTTTTTSSSISCVILEWPYLWACASVILITCVRVCRWFGWILNCVEFQQYLCRLNLKALPNIGFEHDRVLEMMVYNALGFRSIRNVNL